MRASEFITKQGVTEGTNNITYKQQKGKNKFSVEMLVDGKPAGMFQYDANTGRTITELDPAYRGQGLGQRLILKGIYTAAMLGMDYVEDESRTAMFDRALDSLADAGYIVNDEEYWYVTDTGEQFLKQGVDEESQRLDPKCWKGYRKDGTKMKDGVRVNNCIKVSESEYTYEGELSMWFDDTLTEAEYQGRKVKLGKPMQGDVKKFKVYVKNEKGNVVKVNFGDPNMRIKKSNPARRKSFRARHNCANPGPRTKARYWSCRKW